MYPAPFGPTADAHVYRDLFNSHPSPALLMDLNTQGVLDVNEAALRLFGYSRGDYLDLSLRDLLESAQGPAFTEWLRQWDRLHPAGPWLARRANGQPLHLVFSPTFVRSGESQAVALFMHEVTDADASASVNPVSCASLIAALPGLHLIITASEYRIVHASDAYLTATMQQRNQIMGRLLFDVYPDDPDEPQADGVRNLRASLERVKTNRIPDAMPEQRYPVRRPAAKGGGFEERFWHPVNVPVLGHDGEVAYIIHMVEDVAWQRRSTQNLTRAEGLLRIAGRMARLGGWRVDLGSGVITWSDEVCSIHGVPPGTSPTLDEAIGFYAPEWRGKVEQAVATAVEQGVPVDEEWELITTTGERLWVHAIGEVIKDEQGKVVVLQGAFQDITERKQTEAALVLSEQRFRQFCDALPQVVWTAEPNGNVDYANQAFYRYIDKQSVILPATEWAAAVHPEDVEPMAAAWGQSVHSGNPYSFQFRFQRGDGQFRWHVASAVPVQNESGQIVKWYGTAIDLHDQLLAQQETHVVAARLHNTLESLGDGVCTLDRNWTVSYVNAEAERLLRRPRSELVGQMALAAFPELAGTPLVRELCATIDQTSVASFTFHYPPIDRWLGVRAFRSDEGVTVCFRDVSMGHLMAERLRESETRFRTIVQATSDVAWDWDLTTGDIWWTGRAGTIFGHSLDEVHAHGTGFWPAHLHPDDRDRVLENMRATLLRKAEHWSEEFRFMQGDGTFVDVESSNYLILNDHGEVIRLVGGMRDISHRKQVENKLKQQAALLDEVQDAIVEQDMNHVITFWNRSSERIYDWRREQVIGQSVVDLIYTNEEEFSRSFADVVAQGYWRGQSAHRRRDGSIVKVQSNWTLVRDEQGEPLAVLAVHTDLTERLNLEEQLHQSQRLDAIGKLTGGVAHDFNNFLTVILGNGEVLAEKLVHHPELRVLAEMIKTAALRGSELTHHLLAFSRRQALEPKAVQARELITKMAPLLRRTLPASIDLDFVHSEGLWDCLVDPVQLEAALLNLVLNARDAMPTGGRLIVESTSAHLDEQYAQLHAEVRPGPYVLIAVSDTGTGISPAIASRVFDPFFTTKDAGMGTGMGLSMVYGFVKQSGGHIKIYSEVGLGTTVKMYLPRVVGDSEERYELEAPISEAGGTESILLVEDDGPVRTYVEHQLRDLGYRVYTAANAAEALEVCRSGVHIDLLFTDIVMPGGMNGRKLADAIHDEWPHILVLFTSGYTENALVHHGRLDPGVHFLSKPYRRHELATALRLALTR